MKIGDKVRFLNDVGGGRVVGFVGKNLVNVEDDNGFEVPVPIRELVVVGTEGYDGHFDSSDAQPDKGDAATDNAVSQRAKVKALEEEESDPADLPITFHAKPQERRGGDQLNVYLCFMPVNPTALLDTDFETYLVNDSNYYLDYLYLSGENMNWTTIDRGTAEPNTKVYLTTVDRSNLNSLQHLAVEMMAYKQDKPFMIKPAMTIRLNPDLTRFYKLHTFAANDFFEEKVETFDLVRDDCPVSHEAIDTQSIKDALTGAKRKREADLKPRVKAVAIRKEHHDDIEVIDLHADALLDTTRGMSSGEILEYQLDTFRKTMDKYQKNKGKKLVFIHGKGNGVLRNRILSELHRHYHSCTSQDASFREYGFGATMVIIH